MDAEPVGGREAGEVCSAAGYEDGGHCWSRSRLTWGIVDPVDTRDHGADDQRSP